VDAPSLQVLGLKPKALGDRIRDVMQKEKGWGLLKKKEEDNSDAGRAHRFGTGPKTRP